MKILTEKKVVVQEATIDEIENEGLLALLGEGVILFCANFIYAGKLIGVNKTCVKLENCHVVFETGSFDSKSYKDAQKIGSDFYINTNAIESFGKGLIK